MPVTSLDRALAILLWLLAILFIAGIVHVLAIFLLPLRGATQPMDRLAAVASASELTLLPQPAPGRTAAPFSDPAIVQGVCLFDLGKGPLRLHGAVDGDRLLTLSFRTPEGLVFYAMTDRAAQQGNLEILLLDAAQLEALESEDNDDEDSAQTQDLRLVSPTRKGFVIVSALANFPSERREAEERVKAVSCDTQEAAKE